MSLNISSDISSLFFIYVYYLLLYLIIMILIRDKKIYFIALSNFIFNFGITHLANNSLVEGDEKTSKTGKMLKWHFFTLGRRRSGSFFLSNFYQFFFLVRRIFCLRWIFRNWFKASGETMISFQYFCESFADYGKKFIHIFSSFLLLIIYVCIINIFSFIMFI